MVSRAKIFAGAVIYDDRGVIGTLKSAPGRGYFSVAFQCKEEVRALLMSSAEIHAWCFESKLDALNARRTTLLSRHAQLTGMLNKTKVQIDEIEAQIARASS